MWVIHERETLGDDNPKREVLATDVEIADSSLSQAKGLMFRSSIPDDYALVLEVKNAGLLPWPKGPSRHVVHMLFVRMPLDVVWLIDDEVSKAAQLKAWRGISMGKANRIIELPAGTAEEVNPGDRIWIEGLDREKDEDQQDVAEGDENVGGKQAEREAIDADARAKETNGETEE